MNQLKKLFAVAALTACVLPVAAQYPVIPDSVKIRGEEQQKEIDRKSDEAWAKALPVVMSEAVQGRPYKPWASKPEDLIKSNIPAFPGAEGGGAYTPGGRGGKVIVVNSLADSGPGTLREACETGGARIVVFNVSGVIRLKIPINVRAPYITIAGQTAPGDGVCVTGASFLLDTHDIIIRHMRFRRGAQDVFFRDDALGGNCVGNVIIDHCSASWGLDENMSVYRHVYNRDSTGHGLKLPTVNITIQNSIFSEALDCYNHAFGATIGGHNSMFCRNLFASNISRNCSIGMNEDFNLVNNVTFNWWNRSVDGGDETSRLNITNKEFTWTSALTFTLNNEKVKSLIGGTADHVKNEDYYLSIGYPVNSFYAPKIDGMWQLGEETDAAAFGCAPGDIKINVPGMIKEADGKFYKVGDDGQPLTDKNGDIIYYTKDNKYTYSDADSQVLGHNAPKWTMGFQNSFTYKNFDLTIYAYFRWGQMINYEMLGWYDSTGKGNFPTYFNYWTESNPSNDFPALNANRETKSYIGYGSLNYVDGSFFKIKNITLGYTFPERLLKNAGISKCRLYATITNPLTVAKSHLLKDYDPEMNGALKYPLSKQLVFGVNVSF